MTNLNRTTIFTLLLACTTKTIFGAESQSAAGTATAPRRGIAALNDNCLSVASAFLTEGDKANFAQASKEFRTRVPHETVKSLAAKIVLPNGISDHRFNYAIDQYDRQKIRMLIASAILNNVVIITKDPIDLFSPVAFDPPRVLENTDGTYEVNADLAIKVYRVLPSPSGPFDDLTTAAFYANPLRTLACLYKKISPNGVNSAKVSPLFQAFAGISSANHFTTQVPARFVTIKLLLTHGANPNIANHNTPNIGQTCLHLAAANNCPRAALLLLNHPDFTSIDATNQLGRTALHIACYNGFTEMAATLLKYGANSNITQAYGKTALQIARQYKHQDCVELLENHAMQMQDQAA